jgi:uncharacterized lipoprotein YddW (UPF0748 family)
MRNLVVCLGASIWLSALCAGQTDTSGPVIPKQEVRAVWITTVLGLDWPKSQDPEEQQRSLRDMIVKLSAARFNTIFFQVRGRADALYRSRYEPWSQLLTGTLGKDPGWDPLEFMIREAHARGIEVHAWCNTFLAKSGRTLPPESTPRHVLLRHPEWLRLVEGEWWFDPGLPAVREYTCRVVMDIVRHYDVDGIHFDFMRYPGKQFPDDATFKRYGGTGSREDWRRENVNRFVRMFYDSAVALKPMLKIGSAPIGIYSDNGKVKGLRSYDDLFQDSRGWLRDGIQDYLCPQVYWSMGDRAGNPDFAGLAREWCQHSFSRQMLLGVGAYKPDVSAQLPKYIEVSRSCRAGGNAFFRYGSVADLPALPMLYRTLANIPPMKWKDSIPPNPPLNLSVASAGGAFRLRWDPPLPARDGDGAKGYNIYRSVQRTVDINDAMELVSISTRDMLEYDDSIAAPSAGKYFYAVSALDKGNNESRPVFGSVVNPEILDLALRFSHDFKLGQHYPDPPSSIVFIPYEIRETAAVQLKILNEGNAQVMSVVDVVQQPGRYVAAANVSRLKGGTYSYVLVAGTSSLKRTLRIDN